MTTGREIVSSLALGRRRFLAASLMLAHVARVTTPQHDQLFLADYTIATFTNAEGWLLLADDQAAGSDWRDGILTYDFRLGLTDLTLDNRLESLRGAPQAIVLTLESDGGGCRIAVGLVDGTGQYFQAPIGRLDRRGVVRLERTLSDIGGAAWQVSGGPEDRRAVPIAGTVDPDHCRSRATIRQASAS